MKISKIVEKNIEYNTIECVGPLEYIDAKCFVYSNKDNCIILRMTYNIKNKKITFHSNRKEYYFNSKLHCINGPAILKYYNNSYDKGYTGVEFWLNGVPLDSQKYNIQLRKEKIRKLNSLHSI
jgi:hypothetical protein